jgi:CYTH domain-containing protein
MEIEKKYLVDPQKIEELKDEAFCSERIEQYYLNDLKDRWIIRFRKANKNHFITLKSKGLLSREEIEVKISKRVFQEGIVHAKTKILKTRYKLEADPIDLLCYEIDVYDDYDFITCEIEFETEEEANYFEPPEWCIEDVTEDKKYKNINLAKPI